MVQVEDRDPTGFSLADLNYAGVNKNNFGFINRETFAETGWINLNNRFYMPELMRFGQIDPITDEQENYSPYQYAWNNPVLRSDPNGDCPICFFVLAGLFFASQPAMAPSGGKNAKQEMAAYKQAYNDMGSDVVSSIMPGGRSKTVGQALYATVKKEVKEEIKEQAQKATEKASAKKPHKNSNDSEGNYTLYEVKDKDGKAIKVGKADADRTNAEGIPVRVTHSERQAQKKGYTDAKAEVVQPLGKTTTGQAKEAEAARVRDHRANGNSLPLNREKDKRYQN